MALEPRQKNKIPPKYHSFNIIIYIPVEGAGKVKLQKFELLQLKFNSTQADKEYIDTTYIDILKHIR